jgi:hypothetical protein
MRCADCQELLSLGKAKEPRADVAAGRMIAVHGGLAEGEDLYELPLGSRRITTGDQDDAWDWRVDRPIAEQFSLGLHAFSSIDRSVAPTSLQHLAPQRPLSVELIRDAAKVIAKVEGSEPLSGPFDMSDTELVAAIAHSPPREPNVNAALATVGPLYSAEEAAQFRVYCGRCGANPCACEFPEYSSRPVREGRERQEAEQINVQFEESEDGCGNVERIAIPDVDGELG